MEKYFEGIGRRKRSTSRVRIYKGDKASTVEGKSIEEYSSYHHTLQPAAFHP